MARCGLQQALGVLMVLAGAAFAGDAGTPPQMADAFKNPPLEYRSRPLYWLNGPINADGLRIQMQAMRDQCGFGGVTPLALSSTKPPYLTEEYFKLYGVILDMAKKLGLKVTFYDDADFPTGIVGGKLAKKYPGSVCKNLRKVEESVVGPRTYEQKVPPGVLMAAVAMEIQTLQRIDLAGFIRNGSLRWDSPKGAWRVMFFVCVPDGRVVDYLDPDAVKNFIGMTYDEYARRFGSDFGDTITMSFFDDVALCYTTGGRTWTYAFNQKFKQKYGKDPALWYPALWYDIGPDTEAARVALFDFRAELMAEGFVRSIHEWAVTHKIQASGHPAGNYNPQPVEVSGDNMKFYRHCDIPLLDSIHRYGHGRDGFKLPISAAFNYDHPLTAVEIYGNYPDESVDAAMLYRSAMELYVRGANLLLPHGMWYDPAAMKIPPEISHRNARFGFVLPAYNEFVGRCSLMLQGGRHVADIGIVYPVAAMQAAYQFDVPGRHQPNWGYDAPPEADYLAISGRLTGSIRRDFTFLHPEIIQERCSVEGATLRLNNKANWEQYRVLMIPGGKVISWSVLQKIKQFYDNGGRVIATTMLPSKSAEFGHDADVKRAVESMFNEASAMGTKPHATDPAACHIRIEVSGSTIKTLVNGALADTLTDNVFGRGAVGLREAENEEGSFANLKVTSPDGKLLLEDDFAHGLGQWKNTSNATAHEGWLTLKDNQIMRSRSGEDWTDYAIEVDLRPSNTPVGLVFRSPDDNNGYMWQFVPNAKWFKSHRKVQGSWQAIKEVHYANMAEGPAAFQVNGNAKGGKAYFASQPTVGTLRAMLDDALPVGDVKLEGVRADAGGGMLSYIHKVKNGADVYYFANSSDDRVDTWVKLRGKMTPQLWDPHIGLMQPAEFSSVTENGVEVTRVHLVMEPVRSIFVVAPAANSHN